MKITIYTYFKKQEEIKKLEEELKDLMLNVKNHDSLKSNRKYRNLKKDLQLFQKQLKIIEERVGKGKIGQEMMERSMDRHFSWMKEAKVKLFKK